MSNGINSIDIIVPCFNPEDGWSSYVLENFEWIKTQLPSISFKLYIVNDASTVSVDHEVDILRKKLSDQFTMLSYKENMGKGFAIRKGVQQSQADAIIYTDIDFPYVKEDLLKIANALINNNDVVVGVRSKEYYASVPSRRVLLSKIARFLLKNVLRLKVTDTQCGLKGFSSNAKETFLKTKINRFLFDMEFIFRAGKNNMLSITTTEVTLREGVKFSKMNIKVVTNEALNFINLYLFK